MILDNPFSHMIKLEDIDKINISFIIEYELNELYE
jgi:hypothetical protein